MDVSKETILARMEVLNRQLLENSSMISQGLSRETLLDAFVSFFEECSADYLRDNKQVSNFIDTYRFAISELKKLRINISDFEVLQLIGTGNFSSVHLVKERQTGDMFAMKTIRKAQAANLKETCFAEEREIMTSTISSWHTFLQYAFQDSTKLYMVMEYVPGGDLRGLLEREGNVLAEEEAVFYLREILIAISNLHDMGFIHRDIKPDNVLLDIDGHIKLTDFGSAARINSEGYVSLKDNIAAGTPEYIAPEVLLSYGKPNKVYGRSCDYWSVGIIAYEMIFGVTPFTGETTAETYNNILAFEKNLIFPEDVVMDTDYSAFIKQLLTDELIRPDYEIIISHPLFRDTCWDSVRDFVPPYVPALRGPEDTSLFTGIEIQPQPPNIENFMSKTNFTGRNLPFIGYTYTASRQKEGPRSSTGAIRKDSSMLERNQRKIESLRNRLVEFEKIKEDQVYLEQKYEENKILLKNAKDMRITIEQDLATAMTETSSLRKTLEAERNERKDLELRAIDLIRSAKERWKAEEDVRNVELLVLISTQTQQITDLTTSNNELTQKLHKLTETSESCAAELQRLRDVQEQYENKLKNSRDQSRKSFCGLQIQLKQVSNEAESRVESLKKELEDAWHSNQKLQEQSEDIRQQNKLLEAKLKLNEDDFKTKLSERDAQIAKLNETQGMMLADLAASNERENNLQNQVTLLQEAKVKLTAKCVKANEAKQTRELECEQLRTLYSTNSDKINGNLQDAVAEQKAKDEVRVKNLQNTIHQLENEVTVLLPQIQECETSKCKIAELESLVARLEAGKNKDAAATAREELLKEQLQKSQNQVKDLHETVALSNRELNKTKTELWVKEKALKDSGIDARILSRELQDAQNEIKALQGQVKVCEERAKMAEDLVSVDHERARAAESKHLALINENAGLKSRVARLETQVQTLQTMEEEAAALKIVRQELEQKIEIQQRQLTDYYKSAEIAKQLEISAKHEISRLKADLDTQHTAYAALQESSTILEQQVDGYDRLVVTLKNKETSLEAKVTGLENDVAAVQEILNSTKENLKVARNDRIGLDTTIRVLEVQMAELEAEKVSLKEDLARFERRYRELVDSSNNTEKEKNEALLKIQNQQAKINTLKIEILQLKEETSERLTHLLQARENNTILNEELIEQRNEIDRLTDTLYMTEYNRDKLQERSREEICSLAVRLKQFEKVSDSLLDKLVIEERKKKSLVKIFHKKTPDLPRPSTYYELNKQFAALQTEYNELKLRYELLEHSLDTPMSVRVQTAMANASVLDARDAHAVAAARLAKAAVDATKALSTVEQQMAYQEAQHMVRDADVRKIKAVAVAAQAEGLTKYLQDKADEKVKQLKLAREAAQAADSRSTHDEDAEATGARARKMAATTAESSEPRGASTPAQTSEASSSSASNVRAWSPKPSTSRQNQPELQAATSQSKRHCFVHFSCMARRKCRWCWQQIKLLRGASRCQNCDIIVHKLCEKTIIPGCGEPEHLWQHYNYVNRNVTDNPAIPSFDIENINCWLYLHCSGQRLRRYLKFANKTIFLYNGIPTKNASANEFYPLGLPDSHVTIATDVSGQFEGDNLDKYISVQMYDSKKAASPRLSAMLEFVTDWDREVFIDAILSKTNADMIAAMEQFPYTVQTFRPILEITGMVELDNMFLFGGTQGLHAAPFHTDRLIEFSYVNNIIEIKLLSEINSILVIATTNGELVRIDLTKFENVDTLISNTALDFSVIKVSDKSEAVLAFQYTVVDNVITVCAATGKQIIILHFNTALDDFQSIRAIESAGPCSALHILQNSLIICTNKFFNLNLLTFRVREMLDTTDPGLAHVSTCQRAGTYPMSVICLSLEPVEYMLCYSEFAVFVDHNGRKSRQTQINWTHFPLQFVFFSPNLFVFQFSSIEVFRVCPETNENNREHWTCPPSIRLELVRPKYLMSNDLGIYVTRLKPIGVSSRKMFEDICFIPGHISPK